MLVVADALKHCQNITYLNASGCAFGSNVFGQLLTCTQLRRIDLKRKLASSFEREIHILFFFTFKKGCNTIGIEMVNVARLVARSSSLVSLDLSGKRLRVVKNPVFYKQRL